jgi:hypothetical protein
MTDALFLVVTLVALLLGDMAVLRLSGENKPSVDEHLQVRRNF